MLPVTAVVAPAANAECDNPTTIDAWASVGEDDGEPVFKPTTIVYADCTRTSEVTTTSINTEVSTTTEVQSVDVTQEVPTTVTSLTTDQVTETVGTTAYVDSTVFDTALTTVQVPSTTTESSVVEVTWALATTVNPATDQVPRVSLSSYDVQPGQTVTVSVMGFTPGEQLEVSMHSDPVRLAEVPVDSNGSANVPVTIPLDAQAGLHTISVVGLTCGIQATIPFRVTAASGGGVDSSLSVAASLNGGEQLSWTGFDAWTSVAVAVAFLLVGSVMVVAARRLRGGRAGTSAESEQATSVESEVESSDGSDVSDEADQRVLDR